MKTHARRYMIPLQRYSKVATLEMVTMPLSTKSIKKNDVIVRVVFDHGQGGGLSVEVRRASASLIIKKLSIVDSCTKRRWIEFLDSLKKH